jgi:tRNA (cmo5U34)-methyltransferase
MSNRRILEHFEAEAKKYDDIILTLIPEYRQMTKILLSVLPFAPEQPFSVIDLGCGTGTLSRRIRDAFPMHS